MTKQLRDGVAVTTGTLDAAMNDDGARLGELPLARVLGEPHAGADGCHQDEPTPFAPGDVVGTVSAVCVTRRVRPDAGSAGESSIHKGPVDGPVEVGPTGITTDSHSDRQGHGGRDKSLYVLDAAEQRHWAEVLGGLEPGRMGENLLIESGALGGIDDVELGAVLTVGDPAAGGLRLRVTGLRNPCPTFARGMGRADWVQVFCSRNRVGLYLAVETPGQVQASDVVRLEATPGHGVSCLRWFAHHDPRDARAILAARDAGRCMLAAFTEKYLQAAAVETVGCAASAADADGAGAGTVAGAGVAPDAVASAAVEAGEQA